MVAFQLCSIGTWILFVYQGFHGLGRHIDFISDENKQKLGQTQFWQVIISSSLGMALLKISIGLNLLRLSPSRWYVRSLWLSIGKQLKSMPEKKNPCLTISTTAFVSAYSFMGAMTFFLHCKPMEAHWDHTIKGAQCYPIQLFITFALINTGVSIRSRAGLKLSLCADPTTAFNIFTDVLFASIPIPIIWKLQMKRKVRLYLIGILSLGYV